MPSELRRLFVSILHNNVVTNAIALWNAFKYELCEDYITNPAFQGHNHEQLGLNELETLFHSLKSSNSAHGLPDGILQPLVLHDGSKLNQNENTELAKINIPLLNTQQKVIFTAVINAVLNKTNHNCFFIDGPAGSGKTFLLKV